MPYSRHVYHVYAVRSFKRNDLQSTLHTHGIQTGIHYPMPIHLLEAYRDLGYHITDFPYSEQVADEVLSLPMYPELSDLAIEQVCECIGGWRY
ncbi:MAG: DegT/DnrJ/EryC1/StrS family aminotransferase [Candidatus Thorarchaeota archaeon]